MSDTTDLTSPTRRQAAIAAALAHGGAGLRSASLAVGLVAVACGLVPMWFGPHRATIFLAAATVAQVACIGLGQLFGLRIAFDADLFAGLSRDPDLTSFDAAMGELGLLPAAKQGRGMAERVGGLRRLLLRQGVVVVIQLALLLVVALGATGGLR